MDDGYLKLDNGSGFMPVIGGKVKSAGYVIYGTVLSFMAYSKALELNGVIGSKLTCTLELNVRFTDAKTDELVASKIVKV